MAASTMKSLASRRPKPPPLRVMCIVTASSGIPSVLAIMVLPAPGFWVGDQISSLPSAKDAVEFIGSSGECATNG